MMGVERCPFIDNIAAPVMIKITMVTAWVFDRWAIIKKIQVQFSNEAQLLF
jgi:hypothetical protein